MQTRASIPTSIKARKASRIRRTQRWVRTGIDLRAGTVSMAVGPGLDPGEVFGEPKFAVRPV
ncbi:MAG: hypothetical protein QOE89_4128 [Pseudonocardiales bacterium]|nr:hypothetical protein [Pseudonocardiales bacterium]